MFRRCVRIICSDHLLSNRHCSTSHANVRRVFATLQFNSADGTGGSIVGRGCYSPPHTWLAKLVTRQFGVFKLHQNQQRPGHLLRTPLGATALPRPASWWGGDWLPPPQKPHPTSALWTSLSPSPKPLDPPLTNGTLKHVVN